MSKTEDKVKLRDHRKPGWFWAENETFDVFQPFIGALGVAVYLALCREARSTEVRVALRDLEPLAGVKKDTVRRSIIRMEALKMIRVKRAGTSTGAATYELLDLKAAAALGTNELARLLVVAERDKLKLKPSVKSGGASRVVVAQGDNTNEDIDAEVSATTLSQKGPELSQNEAEKPLNCDNLLDRKTDEDCKTTPLPPKGGLESKDGGSDGDVGIDDAGGRGGAAGGTDGGADDARAYHEESGPGGRVGGGHHARGGVQAALRLVGGGSAADAGGRGTLAERPRRQTAAELVQRERAMVGVAPVPTKPSSADALSSFDVKIRFAAAVNEVHDGLQSDLDSTGISTLTEMITNPLVQWTTFAESLVYDHHEVPEGVEHGIALVLASNHPKAAQQVLKENSRRMTAALGRQFGCAVQVQLIGLDGAA